MAINQKYDQILEEIYLWLPQFQNIGNKAHTKTLDNIRELCKILYHPEKNFLTIHVAGTNGKGTTSHLMAAMLQSANKKIGLYTSPHYIDFRERIKINGQWIEKQYIIDFYEKYIDEMKKIKPSFFEFTFALALQYFSDKQVDLAIIEVGLGGTFDSTNIITPLLSVISNIGKDHTDLLGETLQEIASNKAGIIKNSVPVILGEISEEVLPVFIEQSFKLDAPLYQLQNNIVEVDLERKYLQIEGQEYFLTDRLIHRPFIRANLQLAAAAVWHLTQLLPNWPIKYSSVNEFEDSTKYIGRWMAISHKPLIYADSCHNGHGFQTLIPHIFQRWNDEVVLVLAFVKQKNVDDILRLIPHKWKVVLTKMNNIRAEDPDNFALNCQELNMDFHIIPQINIAFDFAYQQIKKQGVMVITGSSFIIQEVLKWKEKL